MKEVGFCYELNKGEVRDPKFDKQERRKLLKVIAIPFASKKLHIKRFSPDLRNYNEERSNSWIYE